MKCILFAIALLVSSSLGRAADTEEQQKINNAVDVLTRLENVNLNEKPAIKAAVEKALVRTRGTANFVRLVQHFRLTNENAGLLEVAIQNPGTDAGVEATRLLLAGSGQTLVKQALSSTNAARMIEALGNSKERQATPWIAGTLKEPNSSTSAQRAAVQALAKTQEGARELLTQAQSDVFPSNLKFLAASELAAVRWSDIKEAAAKALPLPPSQNAEPLPPVSELIKRSGDVTRGAEVFRRDSTSCLKCHQVGKQGGEVGPGLSEIGTKLTREALYESILDPNAGISFGFEAWQVQLKNGDEAYGIKASETPAEVAIKDAAGIVTRFKRAEISSMQQMKTSIMPSGLQQALSTQELVDLIEYLASLKKQ